MHAKIVLRGLVALGLSTVVAGAQASRGSSPQSQEILNYRLTLPRANQLITAMEAMTKYLVSLPDYQDRIAKSMRMTPAEQRAQLEKDSKAMAILKQNDLTAKDYLVGLPALRMALLAAQGVSSPNLTVSPANLAFAKANLAALKLRMDTADGVRPPES